MIRRGMYGYAFYHSAFPHHHRHDVYDVSQTRPRPRKSPPAARARRLIEEESESEEDEEEEPYVPLKINLRDEILSAIDREDEIKNNIKLMDKEFRNKKGKQAFIRLKYYFVLAIVPWSWASPMSHVFPKPNY
jgi:hypothetical protein